MSRYPILFLQTRAIEQTGGKQDLTAALVYRQPWHTFMLRGLPFSATDYEHKCQYLVLNVSYEEPGTIF